MRNEYIITKDGDFRVLSDDVLMHWKYIKREKVNGKWRYFYKEDLLNNNKPAPANTDTTYNKRYAAPTYKETTRYGNGNKLLSKTTTRTSATTGEKTVHKERGKIEQGMAKAKKWMDSKMSKNTFGKTVIKTSDPYDANKTSSKYVTTKYKNSDKLFSGSEKSTKVKIGKDGKPEIHETVTKNRGKVEQAINKGGEWVKSRMASANSNAENAVNKVTQSVKKAVDKASNGSNDSAAARANSFKDAIGKAKSNVNNSASAKADSFKDAIGKTKDTMSESAAAKADSFKDAISKVKGTVNKDSAVKSFTDAINKTKEDSTSSPEAKAEKKIDENFEKMSKIYDRQKARKSEMDSIIAEGIELASAIGSYELDNALGKKTSSGAEKLDEETINKKIADANKRYDALEKEYLKEQRELEAIVSEMEKLNEDYRKNYDNYEEMDERLRKKWGNKFE